MAGLLWLHENDPSMSDAELIVRAARPSRWGHNVRFEASDVERCARAITSDPRYCDDVVKDAVRTAERAGVGLFEVYDAAARLARLTS